MLAFFHKDGKAVGIVIHRGHQSRNLVKSSDQAVKVRLNKLYNSSFSGLSQNFANGDCTFKPATFAPGTEEHFRAVTQNQAVQSAFAVELLG